MQQANVCQFGTTTIAYQVIYTQRKTVAIAVHPDAQVIVTAPEGYAVDAIEGLLHQRAGWIIRQQQQCAQYPAQEHPRAYVSGESYRYLGRQYRLKVLEGEQEGVKVARTMLYTTVREKSNAQRVQSMLEGWYRQQAQSIFGERLQQCYPRIERLGVAYPAFAVRAMKTRWGSCSHTGLITLNPRLIQTSVACIDYVLLHEMCHLKEMNHSKKYYQLLSQVLPDWQARRQKLNTFELY